MPRSARLAKERIQSDALLLRRSPSGESDDIVHLFTEAAGALGAIARGARRSNRRFAALEPMHLLRVSVELSPARELGTLTEASLARPRIGLTSSLRAMELSGRALRWIRHAAPARTPEPALWLEINQLLDSLDGPAAAEQGSALLAAAGLRMLAAAGWALELDRCVRCGKPCPERARVLVDVNAGGVVCRGCGGMGMALSSRTRRAMMAAQAGGPYDGEADAAIALVARAFDVHGRGEGT
jgi:DNA repair protein RecO (recombination protein O)